MSSLENGHAFVQPTSRKNSVVSLVKSLNQSTDLDPDELLTKHTIAEAKLVRQRLRDEADAKQGELRLMVGERYRDLLQASTSIISISHASERVVEAIQDVQDTIVAQGQTSVPKRKSMTGKNDAHLHTLQLLSAHIKLLLDAPEHLWRLLERKQYYSAAWLFLLARVVHRALVSEDQDEESWRSQGLNVLEQFPLVQRQWDAVSQFRSQIIHKATMSFREHDTSAEDNCATLLTLHLLDARPLSDALSVFLSQRSKALHTMISWRPGHANRTEPKHPHQTNGRPPGKNGSSAQERMTFRRTEVQEVKKATLGALGVLFRTLTTARCIFQPSPGTSQSMISLALESIQSESPSTTQSLPEQVLLNTESVLAKLPSSTHFLLLPPNLRSYKPYVDPSSSASCVTPTQLSRRLADWFHKSLERLQNAIVNWFSGLQNVREVWHVRSSILDSIELVPHASHLDTTEATPLKSMLDNVCLERLLDVWKERMKEASTAFRDKVQSITTSLANGDEIQLKEIDPVEYLFRSPPLPTLPQNSPTHLTADISIQRYKVALQRQIVGRTSLVEEVLSILENCGRALRDDLSRLSSENDERSRMLVQNFKEGYRPEAQSLCATVISSLESVTIVHSEETENTVNSLVFVSRVADELASFPSFATNLECENDVITEIRSAAGTFRDRLVDRWRRYTVSKIVRDHWHGTRPPLDGISFGLKGSSSPSSGLMYSLLSLSGSIQHLGVYKDPSQRQQNIERTLRHFIVELIEADRTEEATRRWPWSNFMVLRSIAALWGPGWSDISELLEQKIASLREEASLEERDVDTKEEDDSRGFLERTQTLFSGLLPDIPTYGGSASETSERMTTFLPLGVPVQDQDFQPAFQVAKPSPRFGLLLVGNEALQY